MKTKKEIEERKLLLYDKREKLSHELNSLKGDNTIADQVIDLYIQAYAEIISELDWVLN